MSVEQDGLGSFEGFSIFYEIKTLVVRSRLFVERNAGRTQKGPLGLQAGLRRFITMKLQQSPRNTCASCYYFCSGFVHEEQHRRHKRRQAPRQVGGPFGTHITRARRVQNKPDRISAGSHRSVDVFFPRQPAYLDSGAQSGSHARRCSPFVLSLSKDAPRGG